MRNAIRAPGGQLTRPHPALSLRQPPLPPPTEMNPFSKNSVVVIKMRATQAHSP